MSGSVGAVIKIPAAAGTYLAKYAQVYTEAEMDPIQVGTFSGGGLIYAVEIDSTGSSIDCYARIYFATALPDLATRDADLILKSYSNKKIQYTFADGLSFVGVNKSLWIGVYTTSTIMTTAAYPGASISVNILYTPS
tara:strand:+ start:40 stop:450 length:411 start_codon:yes stop_codon:yes gene_type:complete